MFFYFVMTPVLIASLGMIRRLHSMEKHDRVLFKLCELRREMMALMRRYEYEFSKEDYFALRELVRITNETIHNYSEFKNSMFSLSKCMKYGRGVKRLDKEIHQRKVENETIADLYDRFAFTMFIALMTFIPWPELFLRVIPLVLKLIKSIGTDYLNRKMNRAVEFLSWLRQKSQEYAYR